MKKAIDYVLTYDLYALPLGKTVIDGEKVYIIKANHETKDFELQQYEVHRRYIDIQIDIDGDEKFYIKNDTLNCTHEYNAKEDYALFKSSPADVSANLNKEFCVICFTNEIHMPCVKNISNTVLKCVVKVLAE